MRKDQDPAAGNKGGLLSGFSPLLAKLKERNDDRKNFLAGMRDAIWKWSPAPFRYTKKPILRGTKKRTKAKAVRQARKHNRSGKGRPKGYR